MNAESERRAVFDPLLGYLETFVAANGVALDALKADVRGRVAAPIHEGLPAVRGQSQGFALFQRAITEAEALFAATIADVPKETLMSIARRAPSAYLDGADLLLASLIVKLAVPDPTRSLELQGPGTHGLALAVTDDEIWIAFRAIAIAVAMNNLRTMARWLGKGGRLKAPSAALLDLDISDAVRSAVLAYDRRQPRDRLFASGGFFTPGLAEGRGSHFRIPLLSGFPIQMIEAPLGSERRLAFDRYPNVIDGGAFAGLLRGYDEALKERWGAGADTILHCLTALAALIQHSLPALTGDAGHLAFSPSASPEETEHRIGFAFGLARKGFVRFPRDHLVKQISRVRTVSAPSEAEGEAHAESFIAAFLVGPESLRDFKTATGYGAPFLHSSTGDQIYVDFLLVGDFLTGLIEGAKEWYASQHGDRFVLDLKRWLDRELPGAVVESRRAVPLGPGEGVSDIDLLVRRGTTLIAVECKAYGKSEAFMNGEPAAISGRRSRFRKAVAQARRTSDAFRAQVEAGDTPWDRDTSIEWAVCSPTVEFLQPLGEYGLLAPSTPRIATPEEMLAILRASSAPDRPA